MNRGFTSVLFVVLLVVLLGGVGYWFWSHSGPTIVTEDGLYPSVTATEQSIVIDPVSLYATTSMAVITGTATGLKEVKLEVRDPQRAGSVGDVIDSQSTPVIDGHWSFATPAPLVGTYYSVAIYSDELDHASYEKYYEHIMKLQRR